MGNKAGEELDDHLHQGKLLMDEIRASIGAMQNEKETLLAERIEEVNSIRSRDYLVIFVTLLIGVIVHIVSFALSA